MTVTRKEGSLIARHRAERLARDERQARRPGRHGAPARFRLAHGYLVDFMVEEIARSGEEGFQAGLDAVFAAYGSNFENAIVNLCMNAPEPTARAIDFLAALTGGVVKRLDELRSGKLREGEAFHELDFERREMGDIDFHKRNGEDS